MGIVLAIYIVLLIGFLGISALIFRHTVKYSYLSQKFKTVVWIFAILALGGVILSLYLVISLFSTSSGPSYSYPSVNTSSDINF
ncbi:hypothetical protein JW752_04325 [Candidatus Peregrinibacteria bacterium]|nr:hypothetical protein [Candidatus Peregrinibacteria bacterium]